MAKATRSEWAARVDGWKASGLTREAYAAREGLNARTLGWWASALKRGPRRQAKFVDATALVSTPERAALEVVVGETVRIRIEAGFDPVLLRAVVAALETR